MFYCDACMKEKDWPEALMRSYGPCEICSKVAECNDLPSSVLGVEQ